MAGPIHVKDKTFFFFDYEGTRQKALALANAGVPSAAEKTGDFGEFCAQQMDGTGHSTSGLCSAAGGQLWDPYTGVLRSGHWNPRSAFIPFNNMATYQSPGTNLAGTGVQLPGGPETCWIPPC